MSPRPSTTLRVYTYNVLSSHLSEPTHFTSCKPQYLNPESRLKKTLDKLEGEVKKGSVICLQEVSRTWEGKLHSFFDSHSYSLITGMYGRPFNGYMGVGIAYPRDVYELKNCEVDVLADREKWPRENKPPPKSWYTKFLSWMVSFSPTKLLNYGGKDKGKVECPFELARRRANIQVSLHLSPPSSPSSSFAISTYHMPCAFRTPQMMALHSSLSIRNLQSRASSWGATRTVLAGDFNLKPDSGLYKMMTTGICGKEELDTYPLKGGTVDVGWEPRIGDGMDSCYALKGGEPEYTNYARVRDDPVFIGTLDYVFVSKGGWEVVGVDDVGTVEECDGPLPNDVEPSDHVAIAADLRAV